MRRNIAPPVDVHPGMLAAVGHRISPVSDAPCDVIAIDMTLFNIVLYLFDIRSRIFK